MCSSSYVSRRQPKVTCSMVARCHPILVHMRSRHLSPCGTAHPYAIDRPQWAGNGTRKTIRCNRSSLQLQRATASSTVALPLVLLPSLLLPPWLRMLCLIRSTTRSDPPAPMPQQQQIFKRNFDATRNALPNAKHQTELR